MQIKRIHFLVLGCGLWVIGIFGCAPAPYVRPSPPAGMPGIYHKVERGQTLWRIAKTYNEDLEELARINHIPDTTALEVGQLIFIPNRQKPAPLPAGTSPDDFMWPLRGRVIATFGSVNNNMINRGINIQPGSSFDIVASRSGKVVFSDNNFVGFGKTLIIDHGDGFSSVYARNSELLVKAGDNVSKGALIAKAGSAGRDKSTYLHFEIRKGHVSQNPYFYLP
ncbi:MAG: LysM peptidoglycan-binding domain-containing M23 family metallopeptidase [Candidatus Omnitrophica bacterium]|nr:LysM peptidoglycan-binding domain-containing M23 family metallopeptidase [Candidatus Omnitrophota bacterium]